MAIEDVLNQAGADILNIVGQDAVYQPAVGGAVDAKVELRKGVALQPEDFGGQVWQKGITIEALLSVLGQEPAKGETFTIGSDVYTVRAVEETDGRFVKLVVTA